jgi:predicted heme/steroid binding protein
MKKVSMVSLFFMLVFVLSACATSNEDVTRREDIVDDELRTFTLTELALYDGRDGADAYVAVDGYIYDVTGNAQWPNGLHRGQHQAGQDLTDVILGSPHGRSVLEGLTIVGRLVDEDEGNA